MTTTAQILQGPWNYEKKLPGGSDHVDKRATICAHGQVIGYAHQSIGADANKFDKDNLDAQAIAKLMCAAPALHAALKQLRAEVADMERGIGWSGNGGRALADEVLALLA